MTSLKTECRKFSPNIFNKSKCQNCFRGKDAHSSEALESNRATRKVSCCGYLFVAPDWDFSLPANRNKRWQRRWFVLYDDGELAYSVDEHPETVPQAIIDMNCVLEVADAENVTGNPYALAVTCPDKVHFIKGVSKDESKKWFEVLSKFPRNTVCGKYKRNATFPCIKSNPVVKIETPAQNVSGRRDTVDMASNYSKHNGYSSSRNTKQVAGVAFDPDDDVYPTKDTDNAVKTPLKNNEDKKKQEISTPVLNENNCLRISHTDTPCIKSDNQKTYLKSDSRETRKQHSRSDITKMIPTTIEDKFSPKTNNDWKNSPNIDDKFNSKDWKNSSIEDKLSSKEWRNSPIEDKLSSKDWRNSPIEDKFSSKDWKNSSPIEDKFNSKEWKNECNNGKSCHNPVYLLMSDVPSGKKLESYENFFNKEKTRCLKRQSSFGKKSDLQKQSWPEEPERTIHKSASVPNAVMREDNKVLLNSLNKEKFPADAVDRGQLKSTLSQIRGDPDGCNLDSLPSYCASTAEFNSEQSNESFLKKGWLVKQDAACRWNKYWFVLRNSGLAYFSDPIAEDGGIMDGLIDLRRTDGVSEVDSSSGHSFCITMKDCSKLYLSAVTAKIRSNWIRAILQAANIKDNEDTKDSALQDSPSKSSEPDRNLALPPSPPLARTAMSRVKERAKTRTNTRTRSPKFAASSNETPQEMPDTNYLVDSDDGTTDHSSSSVLNNAVTPVKEKKVLKEITPKYSDEKTPKSERRRSLKQLDPSTSLEDSRKKVTDIKDKMEDSSWSIWLDVSKFCKEVESKLDDLEDRSSSKMSPEQRKEMGNLVSCLGRVEERLHKVNCELERAKVNLMLNGREDGDLGIGGGKVFGCHSLTSYSPCLKQEVSRLSGMSSQNALLAQQLSKIREANRRLKGELKQSQSSSDDFELACIALRKASEQADELHKSNMQLMVARVDDLTSKLFVSEKTVRQLRQRVSKLEQRQERRRSSLKGKEGLSLSKEYEAKLAELELKIGHVEGVLTSYSSPKPNEGQQDAPQESSSLLMRLHNLDRKVKDVSETISVSSPEATNQEDLPKPKIRLQVNLNEDAAQVTNENWNSLSLSTSMTDLTKNVTTSPEEVITKQEDLPKPKIRLQVNLNEDVPQATNEDWNSLSLSASMTDLTLADKDETSLVEEKEEYDQLSMSFSDCLESLGHKVTSLVSWLKTSLQLLYAQGHMIQGHTLQSSRISFEASEELSKLVRTLEFVTTKAEDSPSEGLSCVVGKLLYNIILLQEVSNVVFKMSDFDKYKVAVLVQHLMRVKHAIIGIERYISEKSSPVQSSGQKISLCNIVACLLFYKSSSEEVNEITDASVLFEEVDGQRRNVFSILAEFKSKFIERFCTTILELSEDSVCDKVQRSPDQKPVGQKQFLSHISHIVAQVSQSFSAHITKSTNDVYFLSTNLQYGEKWTEYLCKLLQQELSLLSSEIKGICVKHLENGFFSSSKCGVLVEYMHCSISELAQIVAILAVVDGTVVLVKEALYGGTNNIKTMQLRSINGDISESSNENIPLKSNEMPATLPNIDKAALNTFHENLHQRAIGIMSNLPQMRFPNAFFSLCNPNELSVAHRSVSSLLCFKQRWQSALEGERKGYLAQMEELTSKLSQLRAEQRNCRSCFELRQEVSYLQGELDESRALARSGSLCDKCRLLRLEMQRLTAVADSIQEKEQVWKEHLEVVVKEKEKQFEEEKEKLERELHVAQGNIKRLERHYDEEIRSLQNLYEEKLQQKNENLREDIKLRYSEEIQQLKALCEKGVCAMDASHKKMMSELERRHQRELEELTADREKALAEEAHATAVALEAVRKAHSEELQKQVQKFKDEFILKMNKRFETEAFKKCYESDLSNVKYEILSMTEKYSVKCLENATLHEKLETMNHQLKSTTTQVVELLAKNEQLQARLTSGIVQNQEESII